MDYQEAIHCMKVMADEEVCEECNCYQSCDHTKQADMARIAISAMQELQEYNQLGTLEEVRETVEKQKEERPQKVLGTFGGEEYECRECGNTVEYMDDYCKWCGKAQDWSEEE